MTNVISRSRCGRACVKLTRDAVRAAARRRGQWPGTRPVQTRAGRLVRHAELVVLAFTVVLALVEAGRIAALYGGRSLIIAGWLPPFTCRCTCGTCITACGTSARQGRVRRSVVALVQFAALALIGPAWSFVLATLATSAPIVLRPPWSLAVLALCVIGRYPRFS
jgi:polyferredoxin